GLATDLAGEGRDVVGDKPIHRRYRPQWRRIPGRCHGFADLEPVVLVEGVVELGVGVVILLTRVRVRRVHVGGDRVRHNLGIGAVLRPLRNRVAQVLADDPVEVLTVLGAVEVPEHIVEGAVSTTTMWSSAWDLSGTDISPVLSLTDRSSVAWS